MVGMNSGYIASLPAPVKRRLKALKKIQLESTKIEAKFYEEVHKLECKYHEIYRPLYDQRSKITKGNDDFDVLFGQEHSTRPEQVGQMFSVLKPNKVKIQRSLAAIGHKGPGGGPLSSDSLVSLAPLNRLNVGG